MLSKFLDKINAPITFNVIGDVLIDEFYRGKISRISPESENCRVIHSFTEEPYRCSLGGSGNVAVVLKHFNQNVNFYGFSNELVVELLKKEGINNYTVSLDKCFIPKKKRFFSEDTQISDRWDIERKDYDLTQEDRFFLLNQFKIDKTAKINIVSDYNKGTLFNLSFMDGLNNKILDPKNPPISRWRGYCDILKLNKKEAFNLSDGIEDWRNQCDLFQKSIDCHSIVITDEGNGIVGKSYDKYFDYRPSSKVLAKKTSGAGDAYIAILGLAIANDFAIEESAKIAFDIGRIYVQLSFEEILDINKVKQFSSKIVTVEELLKIKDRIVFTNGVFDFGLSKNHIEILKFAKQQGSILVVGINTDESVQRLKGNDRPILPLEERMAVLEAVQYVDYVVPFSEDTPLELIKKLKPAIIVKGGDYSTNQVVGASLAEVRLAPLFDGMSTTQKIAKKC